MPERQALSPCTIRYSEVAAVVERVLESTGYFPPNARPSEKGKTVHEPALLQKVYAGAYRLILQRGQAIAPYVLAEKLESDFQDSAAAIKAFIAAEWRSGDIDGIIIKS